MLTTDECYCSDLNQTSASTFKVVVENIICGSAGFTCTKTVTFTFQNVTIVLARGSEPVITPPPQDGAELQYKIRSTLRFVLISTKQGECHQVFLSLQSYFSENLSKQACENSSFQLISSFCVLTSLFFSSLYVYKSIGLLSFPLFFLSSFLFSSFFMDSYSHA